MREFKFRIWHGGEGYITNDFCAFSVTADGNIFNDEDYDISDSVVLMQYTGKKDIEGKEIYESDIVAYHRHEGAYYESTPVYKIGLVIWDDTSCSFRLKHNGGDPEKLHTSHRLKVVGNIFENPELLGGENNE